MNDIHPKVFNAAVAGAITVIVIWGLSAFVHVQIPQPVADALVVLIGASTGYQTPSE